MLYILVLCNFKSSLLLNSTLFECSLYCAFVANFILIENQLGFVKDDLLIIVSFYFVYKLQGVKDFD